MSIKYKPKLEHSQEKAKSEENRKVEACSRYWIINCLYIFKFSLQTKFIEFAFLLLIYPYSPIIIR